MTDLLSSGDSDSRAGLLSVIIVLFILKRLPLL